jgi:nicotinic acid mononucleotide adenylyltransferase
MAITAQEVFRNTVHALPPTERLRLVALILQDLLQSEVSVVDHSDTWNEQDQHDLTAFTLQHAAKLYPEDEELA